MSLYEITFLTKEETDPGVRALIEQAGGQVTEESSLGRRRLTYPINKQDQAVYTTFAFDLEKPALAELNRKLNLNNDILRFLIVVKPTVRVDKEMSKTVREAIAAAEKLEDTPAFEPAGPSTLDIEPVVETPIAVEAPVETLEPVAEPVAKKPRAKKSVAVEPTPAPADAAEATEEDRLKALEDKLSDILKD
jgi:small subunit ribosomal protein S6